MAKSITAIRVKKTRKFNSKLDPDHEVAAKHNYPG